METKKKFIPKHRFDEVNEQLKAANKTMIALQENHQENEELQQQVNLYKEKIINLEKLLENTRKEFALKQMLRDMGAVDVDYIIYKHGGVEAFSFNKEGKLMDVEPVVRQLRESFPYLFLCRYYGG